MDTWKVRCNNCRYSQDCRTNTFKMCLSDKVRLRQENYEICHDVSVLVVELQVVTGWCITSIWTLCTRVVAFQQLYNRMLTNLKLKYRYFYFKPHCSLTSQYLLKQHFMLREFVVLFYGIFQSFGFFLWPSAGWVREMSGWEVLWFYSVSVIISVYITV